MAKSAETCCNEQWILVVILDILKFNCTYIIIIIIIIIIPLKINFAFSMYLCMVALEPWFGNGLLY